MSCFFSGHLWWKSMNNLLLLGFGGMGGGGGGGVHNGKSTKFIRAQNMSDEHNKDLSCLH